MKKIQHIAEFIIVKPLVSVLMRLPLPVVSFFAYTVGCFLLMFPLGIKKKSLKQVQMALPELTLKQQKRIAKRSAIHMLQTFLETPRIYHMPEKCLTKRLTVFGWEQLEGLNGAVMLTAHFGNWEVLLRYLTAMGHASTAVYRPANNGLVDDIIKELRLKTGVKVSPKGKEGARTLIKACRDGEFLGILNDQKMNNGEKLKMFGLEAWTSTGFADLVLRYEKPAVPFFCRRTGFGQYEIEVLPQLNIPAGENAKAELTQNYNDMLEDYIRKYPEQWMWQHNRFKG